ncbi:MAG: hypothetical protein K2L96_03455 [Muribaculaceae bacterium]|nr:hypothetical protein [Muribaculaceae bacterium]
MALKEILQERIHSDDIRRICALCCNDNAVKEELYALIFDPEARVAYNALWVFTQFSSEERMWLLPKREMLIDLLLSKNHIGMQRLLFTLLDRLPARYDVMRPDYLDFCLSKINSGEPYAVRALSLKQAYVCCRAYPELMRELLYEIDRMENGNISPGLQSARRNILRKLTSYKTMK